MVCCDQCEVWQHCECMGLEEHEIPDQYYCELCKPSDHVEVKGYDKYVLFIALGFLVVRLTLFGIVGRVDTINPPRPWLPRL